MADLPDQTDAVINHLYAIGESAQAEAIEILVARLAQAEAERDAEKLVAEQALSGNVNPIDVIAAIVNECLATRAALARVTKLHDEVQHDDYMQVSLLRAALVVADTGEGLSKTSAKPLVVTVTEKDD